MMKRIKIVVFLFVLSFSGFSETIAETEKQISDEQKELERINTELADLSIKLKHLKQEEEGHFIKLEVVNKKLEKNNRELRKFNRDLKRNSSQKKTTQKEITNQNKRIKDKRKVLKKRLIKLYQSGSISEMELLFKADGIKNYLKNKKYLQHLSLQDYKKIEEINSLITSHKALEKRLETEELNIKKYKELVQSKMGEIIAEKQNKKAAIDQIKKQRDYYFAKKNKLEEASKQVKELLATLSTRVKEKPVVTKKLILKNFSKTRGQLSWPIDGKVITHFGKEKNEVFGTFIYHDGIEIISENDINVRSVFKGRVLFNAPFENFGNMVVLDHGNSYYTLYAYLKKSYVNVGDVVEEGEKIASIGENFIASIPTLYFEIRKKGNAINPEKWFKKLN